MAITSTGGYTEIARVLHEALEKEEEGYANAVRRITVSMANLFQQDNPRGFDTQRFYAAVGIIPSEEKIHGSTV